jgi:hypothetical protein
MKSGSSDTSFGTNAIAREMTDSKLHAIPFFLNDQELRDDGDFTEPLRAFESHPQSSWDTPESHKVALNCGHGKSGEDDTSAEIKTVSLNEIHPNKDP